MVREESLKKKGGGDYFITCIFGQYEKSFSSKMQMFQLLPVEYYSCHNIRLLISLGIWTNKKWSNIESGGAAKKYIRFVLVASWQYHEIFVWREILLPTIFVTWRAGSFDRRARAILIMGGKVHILSSLAYIIDIQHQRRTTWGSWQIVSTFPPNRTFISSF